MCAICDWVLVCVLPIGTQGIPKESWDALLRPEESPFMEHDWLRAMETSKCATVDTGGSRPGDGALFCSHALGSHMQRISRTEGQN